MKTQRPKCRFCEAPAAFQSIKGYFVYGGKRNQHFWQCEKCQMIYLNPSLKQKEEEKFYRVEFEKFMAKRAGRDMNWFGPEKHFRSNQREVQRRMPFLKPYLKKGRRVLEIGCSSGFMLSALKEKGQEVYGLDPSGGFVDYVRAKGIPVFKDAKELKKHCRFRFDLIIHYYVLEHIRNPVDFIRSYMEWLSDGKGLMVFEVPCACDPLVELYKIPAFDKFYWSIAHHWYFNKESLSRVLRKTGYPYKLLPEQRYDISNHLTWAIEGKPGGLGRYSHIFGKDFDCLYRQKLKEHWQCDTIVAVVNKK